MIKGCIVLVSASLAIIGLFARSPGKTNQMRSNTCCAGAECWSIECQSIVVWVGG